MTIPHLFRICADVRAWYLAWTARIYGCRVRPNHLLRFLASSTHFIIMAGLNARGLQSKLLIAPLSEWIHNIILLNVLGLQSKLLIAPLSEWIHNIILLNVLGLQSKLLIAPLSEWIHNIILLNVLGLQSKLLITPLSELSHNVILQVWCSLTFVTTTLGLLFTWLHILHCTVVITLGNLSSFPSYSCLVLNYDTMIMQFYYWLVSYYNTCINQCNLCWNEAL